MRPCSGKETASMQAPSEGEVCLCLQLALASMRCVVWNRFLGERIDVEELWVGCASI